MKSFVLKTLGVTLCVVFAAAIAWGTLPATNAEGDACPIEAAKGEKAACATKAAANVAKAEKSGECCESGAKPAVATGADKAEISLAADKKSGECCESGAKPAVAKGECPEAAAAALKTAEAKGECPLAAAAALKTAEAKGECSDAAAASLKTAEAKGECSEAAAAALKTAEAKGECDASACDGKAKNIANLVMNDARFTTLALAAKAAGMTDALNCPNQKTVFAPTNEAFQKIPADQWAALLQDDAKLKAVLANHIVTENALLSCAMKEAKTAKAAGGCDLAFSACAQSGAVSVNGAKVVGDALVASNGVVHVIDTVLVPADMQVAKAEGAEAVQVAAAE
ncbi:MAG TPA: fasciclin domain-containing protein [Candidatus Hydrogenedentes bacterium]|nr:fasciclin domain-containing protein [Candidatus Hydrogenedentota bacterium]